MTENSRDLWRTPEQAPTFAQTSTSGQLLWTQTDDTWTEGRVIVGVRLGFGRRSRRQLSEIRRPRPESRQGCLVGKKGLVQSRHCLIYRTRKRFEVIGDVEHGLFYDPASGTRPRGIVKVQKVSVT
jgi:hypothetical protein